MLIRLFWDPRLTLEGENHAELAPVVWVCASFGDYANLFGVIGQESVVQSGLSDGAVIAASLEDGARFGEIFDRHFGEIDRYLARRVGWVVADEIASEVFVIAFRSRGRYDGAVAERAAVAVRDCREPRSTPLAG